MEKVIKFVFHTDSNFIFKSGDVNVRSCDWGKEAEYDGDTVARKGKWHGWQRVQGVLECINARTEKRADKVAAARLEIAN